VIDLNATPGDAEDLRRLARDHLWLHFKPARMADDIPIIARAQGCHLWDADGRRYLDALSSLFAVNIGHGRADVVQAAVDQARELDFATIWWHPHPPAIRLAAKVAELAPGDLNRVFFTSGGSEAVDSALKLMRQYHRITGNPRKTKVIARRTSYHGTTFGALSATGITGLREPYEPMTPGGVHVPNTNLYRLPPGVPVESLAEAVADAIAFEGPDTVGAVILEPVQNAGGCIPAPPGYFQRVREICDQHDVLMISDEVIGSWGRLGAWFGAERFGYQPDILTTAKGITSGYAPLGAMIVSDRIADAFGTENLFAHGFTFGGHPMATAVALANIDVMEREGVIDNVVANESLLQAALDSLRDIPIVGDVRGAGYFWAVEMVACQSTKQKFTPQVAAELTAFITAEVFRRGVFCRAENRGDPVIQLAPPLIAGPDEFAEILAVLRPLLEETSERLGCTV